MGCELLARLEGGRSGGLALKRCGADVFPAGF